MSPANDNRPPEFDTRLLAYMPALTRRAQRLAGDDYEALLNDTVLFACEKWGNFRGNPAAPKSGFYMWLVWSMRGIHIGQRRKGRLEVCSLEEIPDRGHAPTQEADTDLGLVADRLQGRRNGNMLMRLASGEKLREIGAEYGVSVERVRQICGDERRKLAGMVA